MMQKNISSKKLLTNNPELVKVIKYFRIASYVVPIRRENLQSQRNNYSTLMTN